MALNDAKLQQTQDRLAAYAALPNACAWLTAARSAAHDRVISMGLPVARDEYWRFTKPASLVASKPEAATITAEADGPFKDVDALKVVFIDGIFDPEQSDALELEGVQISRLQDASGDGNHWAAELYGVLETKGQKPVERSLASLNTAQAQDGVLIFATAKVSRPIHIIYQRRDEASDSTLHHLVKLAPNANLTVLESGSSAARSSHVMEIDVAEQASFNHVRFQGASDDELQVTHCFTQLAKQASFKSFTLTFNGQLTRNESVIDIQGDHVAAHVAGACLGDGRNFHHDDTVFVTHDAQHCESRQVFKKVLRNGATGVFQGKILVQPDAQKTDGYQISQSLLLDDDSQFLAKPELEIYADDVACSHGSTSGAIDETALFYLRSRGIPEKEAHVLLTLAFLAEALDEIADETLASTLQTHISAWLGLTYEASLEA